MCKKYNILSIINLRSESTNDYYIDQITVLDLLSIDIDSLKKDKVFIKTKGLNPSPQIETRQ